MMAQGKLVVVKRQYKDQVWREAISLQEYQDLRSKSNQQWEQTHEFNNQIREGDKSPRSAFSREDSQASSL